jgi:diaminohydroxyphosphoribosylaminopyrimidine deaminase/5-amino-6-(5-phosphoribosylamino)uracil reductase
MRSKRPWVRCKMAMSLDGRTALASGVSQWITGPEARQDVQRLRARSSALVTGIGTVLADDPALSVRLAAEETLRQPLRVVLDPELEMSPQARILAQPGKTVVVTRSAHRPRAEPLLRAGAEVQCLPGAAGGIDLMALLDWLGAYEQNEVLVESGATLAGSMWAQGLVDELVVYLAPVLMGDGARGLFHLPGILRMTDKRPLSIGDVRAVGRDWRITARPLPAGAEAG